DGAGVKGFGTDVDDAHDRDRRSVTERDPGEIGPGPARHVSRYHLKMGAPTWPPYPQTLGRAPAESWRASGFRWVPTWPPYPQTLGRAPAEPWRASGFRWVPTWPPALVPGKPGRSSIRRN